ncbi:MAG TPA: DUF4416 family protein [Acidobacteriota bacterium]|nr:DUF4416 family protein [Acidobacteriota bacterium]
MARIQIPPPGRLVISIIYSHIDAVADSLVQLEKQFGRIQCETVDIPYTHNDKYSEEMGEGLMRRFFSFEKPVARDALPEIKAACRKIERQLGDRVDDYTFRTVNIDPGILSPDNLVMASHREYNHRIYLARGVFAETQLIWARGKFTRLPWTSPDFCHDEAVDFFLRVRQTFDVIDEEQAKSPVA